MRLLAPIHSTIRMLLDVACGSRCAGCGRHGSGTVCPACRCALDQLARPCDAAFLDEGAARRIVRVAKHGHWRRGGIVLAAMLIERIEIPDIDLVTWVPADPHRRARRGGCLPERLARAVAHRLGMPCAALLERHVPGSQRGQNRAARRDRAARSYRVIPTGCHTLPRGARVLLLDDVRTTGATLDACARMLRAEGLIVITRAIVGVGSASASSQVNDLHPAGVASLDRHRRGIAATSAEFPLTTRTVAADTLRHER